MTMNLDPGLVVSIVDPQPGETIIDCCAAPGGKTLFMAACLSGQGNLFIHLIDFFIKSGETCEMGLSVSQLG